MQSIIDKKVARELRKSRADLASLKVYLSECEDVKDEYDAQWNSLFYDIKTFFGIEQKEKTSDIGFTQKDCSTNTSKRKEIDPKSDMPGWVKKAFRRIAMKTHPDKIKNKRKVEKMTSLFNEASNYIEEKNFSGLIEICKILDIEVDLDPKLELESNLSSIEKTRKKIKSIESTVPWIWGESEGNQEFRIDFLTKVLPQLGINNVTSEQLNNYFYSKKS